MPVNVLYLGMAHDIMAPLLLVPDLDNLFVLNSLDEAYGTWKEHKMRIRKTLMQGNDKDLAETFWWEEKSIPEGKEWKNVHKLAGSAKIHFDKDENVKECLTGSPTHDKWCYTLSVWKLRFTYNGKMRNLIYYYDFNFTQYPWPPEITNIHYHIWNGSYWWDNFVENPEEILVREMLVTRSAPESYVFALSFNHRKFPEHIWVYNGHERYGQSVAKLKLDFSDPNWWKKNYNRNSNSAAAGAGSGHAGGRTRRRRGRKSRLSRKNRS